ncbi:MAG: porin [Achromobacter sp.]|jgi:GBP family porin|uniref:Outer membrane porin protein n=2 Tax=Achromobacter insuavis TaxID=1287735 RepID=A0A6J5I8F0_9BURK|nr:MULTISPECIES: porin [Achromobacter]MBN9640942.1 porin [Achromobacter sp.]CAB3666843.1 Outer membrane porin protein [Achromobacter insuavis]CAB3898447.1 Outer membrane porin protein [Achromobacter insuavis]CUJ59332.1 Outer membrane porin protein BP0840 precursor [Achromobacter sp. 2789STDY5608633]CUJ71278.1 Outer membrane porin protein BP0840 precursor [Achromobacter sp. 2789STDY5608628]
MKKALLVTALFAVLSGAAQAETAVTLYGLIDTGVGFQRIKGNDGYKESKVGVANGVSSGSRWGLRGAEDLGDGLSAVFTLESGFNSANGQSGQSGRLFGRQATVGLKGDSWGLLEFGRQTNVASKYIAAINPFGTSYGQASVGTAFSAANTVRHDNMVMYQTPSFSGFQFGLGYSFSADDTKNGAAQFNADGTRKSNPSQTGFRTANNTRAITAGLRYVNGPLNVALTYDQLNPANQLGTDGNPKQWILGGSYNFEVIKLALAYGQTREGWLTGRSLNAFGSGSPVAKSFGSNIVAKDFKSNSYLVGLSAPVGGAGSILASWQRADANNTKLTGDDATMNIFSLGYTYNLSKRTNLYALGSYATNFAFIDGVKSTVGIVGVRHRF